jgi:hypothetical protein
VRLHTAVPALALIILLAGCGNPELGTGGPPSCQTTGDIESATVIQFQAVPTATWGPCIETLQPEWDYVEQVVKKGEARFWLASEGLGTLDRPFLEVTLTEACDPGDAEPMAHPVVGVQRFVDVRDRTDIARVVIVPVAPRHEERAVEVAAVLHGLVGLDGTVITEVDAGADMSSIRIQAALAADDAVVVIDDREVADGTLELILPGGDEPQFGLTSAAAVESVLDALPDPVYIATWYDIFVGGCITYGFNAHGDRATAVGAEVDRALGLFPLGRMRDVLTEELGYDIAVE